jgi:hypothetical protein
MHWNNWRAEKMFPLESRPVDFLFQMAYGAEIDHGALRLNEAYVPGPVELGPNAERSFCEQPDEAKAETSIEVA